MSQTYYSILTQYGLDLVQNCISDGIPLIAQNWYIALGTGNLTPSLETTELVNVIYDKDSPNYPGIRIENDPDLGRAAFIKYPFSLEGNIITELGLFDEEDNLVACAKCHDDLTIGYSSGVAEIIDKGISLLAIPADLEIIVINPPNANPTIEQVERILEDYQVLSEKAQNDGYCPLDERALVPKIHLPKSNLPFCANFGNVDSSGNANILNAPGSGTASINLEYTTPGSYTVVIPATGEYTVECYGGGGSGYATSAPANYSAGGGSGAGFNGILTIPAGTYTVTVGRAGGGATVMNNIITAGGGGSGGWGVRGAAGVINVTATIVSSTLNNNGNPGAAQPGGFYAAGGASLSPSGWGRGGSYSAGPLGGYFKIFGTIIVSTATNCYFNVGSDYRNLIATTVLGNSFEVSGISPVNIAGLDNDVYNVFLNSVGGREYFNNTIYRQKNQPTSPATNDIWLDTSVESLRAYKYSGTEWQEFDDVPLGQFTVAGGYITAVKTFPFNDNGAPINRYTISGLGMPSNNYIDLTLGATLSTYKAPENGYFKVFWLSTVANQYVIITNTNNNFGISSYSVNAGASLATWLPVLKDEEVIIAYTATQIQHLRFYHAEGSK